VRVAGRVGVARSESPRRQGAANRRDGAQGHVDAVFHDRQMVSFWQDHGPGFGAWTAECAGLRAAARISGGWRGVSLARYAISVADRGIVERLRGRLWSPPWLQ